ncbi:MAG: hypothetical protein LIP28_09625 [Deltaproteobacteria bacterium]|nr:hypothetical protein [Deltaproteobacteria bacterium]
MFQAEKTETMSVGILRGGPMLAGVEVSVKQSESHTLSAQATRASPWNPARP